VRGQGHFAGGCAHDAIRHEELEGTLSRGEGALDVCAQLGDWDGGDLAADVGGDLLPWADEVREGRGVPGVWTRSWGWSGGVSIGDFKVC